MHLITFLYFLFRNYCDYITVNNGREVKNDFVRLRWSRQIPHLPWPHRTLEMERNLAQRECLGLAHLVRYYLMLSFRLKFCAGVAELVVFHPVDTVAKRLMSNKSKVFVCFRGVLSC